MNIKEFNLLLEGLSPHIGDGGGRSFLDRKKKESYKLNQLVGFLRVFEKSGASKEQLRLAAKNIRKLDASANEELAKRSFFIRQATRIRQLFGNLFFQREPFLNKWLEGPEPDSYRSKSFSLKTSTKEEDSFEELGLKKSRNASQRFSFTVSTEEEDSVKESAESAIVRYLKGEQRTASLVPTKKNPLGKGQFGAVHIHKNDSKLVVKKSEQSLKEEFLLGRRLDHPSLVKMHRLFIKEREEGPQTFKMVMERIEGKPIAGCYLGVEEKLECSALVQALKDLKSCTAYLFLQGVAWGDVNDGNLFIEKEGHLKICDFGGWSPIEDKKERTKQLLLGAMESVGWLVKSSFIREEGMGRECERKIMFPEEVFGSEVKQPQILSAFGFSGYESSAWGASVSEKLSAMQSDEEFVAFLEGYIDAVIKKVRQANPALQREASLLEEASF